MKILKWALIIWASCVTLLVLLAVSSKSTVTETHVFCAYGRVFVEFDENGKRWGTIMLDYNGRPMPCREDHSVKIENII